MTTKENIINHLNEHNNITHDFLKSNSLLSLGEYFGFDDICYKNQNKLNYLYNQKILCSLVKELNDRKIGYIVFKGICLAEMLYDNPVDRKVGDIDLYVEYDNHCRVIKILNRLGINKENENECEYDHHIVLTNSKALIELHKNILNPCINIDETYLKNNTSVVYINKTPIVTFSLTATILHLIYHLYMDSWFLAGSLYNIYATKIVLKAGRFLYRAYEIALYSEKYFKEINWNDVEEDIRHQKLCLVFKKMMRDILEIFPNAFPDSFAQMILQLEYVDAEE
ncbi:hypothetical protein C823_004223 [Eubacterium plexicaudatum ASF492]|jgi:hypothetical protein|uniref:Uncharacterized protein n=1 Tax=Eubacterium plexicaudatum ASF492 TaxID=1235802 RepID=N2AFP1_9FIRM|nr:hypothetical protein C823_004223 [Eubacterium plexicaudatum ASF492]